MKQFIRIIILLIMACISLCACPEHEDEHRYITIINQSDKEIAYQELINWSDTSFYCSSHSISFLFNIPANSSRMHEVNIRSSSWESYLNNGQIMDIFVADAELYEEYWQQPCDTIRKYVPILHNYRLTLEDLQRMNWTVVYPPEE